MSRLALAFGQQPTPADAQPQQAGQGAVNKYTYYNNWNMYMSCRFDVLGWHTRKTCLMACHRPNHHKNCNRTNYL